MSDHKQLLSRPGWIAAGGVSTHAGMASKRACRRNHCRKIPAVSEGSRNDRRSFGAEVLLCFWDSTLSISCLDQIRMFMDFYAYYANQTMFHSHELSIRCCARAFALAKRHGSLPMLGAFGDAAYSVVFDHPWAGYGFG